MEATPHPAAIRGHALRTVEGLVVWKALAFRHE